jgi:glutathione S-transferase
MVRQRNPKDERKEGTAMGAVEYVSVAEAKDMKGVRLALTANVPGPWSMSAKTILGLKGIAYVPVEQVGGGENPELVAWTGHRNAPVLIEDGRPPLAGWLEILLWAERRAPEPALLPPEIEDRAAVIGWSSELASPGGFAWSARLCMLDAMVRARGEEALASPMVRDYGYSEAELAAGVAHVQRVLDALAARLHGQREAGSRYIVGERFTAVDLYWAYFSQLLDALPDEMSLTPVPLRKAWAAVPKALARAGYEWDPVVIEHRDAMFAEHLPVPLQF